MARPPKNSLSFFKVFNKETSSDKLKIPSAYTLHMLGTLSQRVSLRDQYGNHWSLKLAQIENELYFKQGWAKFVEDNSMESGDFIFFHYCDDEVFDFKLTGRNACDKKGVGALKFKEKEEEHVEAKDVDTEEGSNDMEMAKDENQQVKSPTRKVAKPKSKDTDGGLGESSKGKNVQEGVGTKRERTKAPDPYGADIFKSGILPQPKNPYFVTKIRSKRRDELYIPIDVIRDFSLELPLKATLRDSSGRTWSTDLSTWGDGRTFYTGGWKSLCRVNLVADEDLCICEFLKDGDQDQAGLVIQVQIVPTQTMP